MKLIPENLTITSHSENTTSVGWRQGTHRFHVWLRGVDANDTIYHNDDAKPRGRTTHIKLESHPHVRAAIDALSTDAFAVAKAERIERENAAHDRQLADSLARCIEHANSLGYKLVKITD